MELYTSFDYLCNEPFYLNGIGYVSCPTLRDIRLITYRMFSLYANLLTISPDRYREMYQPDFSNSESIYDLVLADKPQLLYGLLRLFVTDLITFQEQSRSFIIYRDKSGEAEKEVTGRIGSDNFDTFRTQMQCVLGLTRPETAAPKFKNNYARAMYESMQKQETKPKKAADDNYQLDNMIKKYCTHNKVGINILTVWDMTYYQFIAMFNEYCNGRHYDFNDLMAASTFSYKKSSEYKPGDFMKKLN